MILNETNIIYSKNGVDEIQKLDPNKAILYRSPSKATEYTDIIKKSSTIKPEYFNELNKMQVKVSVGSTGKGIGENCKNVHLYSDSEADIYLDGILRIGYLYQDGMNLKVCEYKKGTRGSRYSSLYEILKRKLRENKFKEKGDSFIIDSDKISLFVEIVNEICKNKKENKYVLIKSSKTDALDSGIFNVAYWDEKPNNVNCTLDLDTYSAEIITKINECNNLNELEEIETKINKILCFCQSKINAIKMIK